MAEPGNQHLKYQVGPIDNVPNHLLDPNMKGTTLDELLSRAGEGVQARGVQAPPLPREGWRMIEEHEGLSVTSNQAWVAPAADGTWHQINVATLRRDGSKRVDAAPFQLRALPSRADRRAPLQLAWTNDAVHISADSALSSRFQLELTNIGSVKWGNEAKDKATIDLLYPERPPGFIELVIGDELPDLAPHQSTVLEAQLVQPLTPGTYSLTAELVDLKLTTSSPATLTVV